MKDHPPFTSPSFFLCTLQRGLDFMEKWFHKRGFEINEKKSTHVIFTLRKQTCPQVTINNITVPKKDTVRYLGITLDRRLTWKQHITDKSKQLRDKLKKFYWLIGRRSNLSTQNKITLYKTVIKPVCTYGIQLNTPTLPIENAKIPGMLPTKQSTATSRYPQSKKKYTSPEADITQESTITTTY